MACPCRIYARVAGLRELVEGAIAIALVALAEGQETRRVLCARFRV